MVFWNYVQGQTWVIGLAKQNITPGVRLLYIFKLLEFKISWLILISPTKCQLQKHGNTSVLVPEYIFIKNNFIFWDFKKMTIYKTMLWHKEHLWLLKRSQWGALVQGCHLYCMVPPDNQKACLHPLPDLSLNYRKMSNTKLWFRNSKPINMRLSF